jgi:hypothetical protein
MDMNAWRIAPPRLSGAALIDLQHTGDQSARNRLSSLILTLDQANFLSLTELVEQMRIRSHPFQGLSQCLGIPARLTPNKK